MTPETLYRQHRVFLLRVAGHILDDSEQAKDVVHDAFIGLIARWDDIDPERALGYLYRSVGNRSRSWLRRRRTAREYRPDPILDGSGADVLVLQAEVRTIVLAAVLRLPIKQRHVIVLRYFRGLSVAATADTLGMTENAVAVNAHRALKTLQTRLGVAALEVGGGESG